MVAALPPGPGLPLNRLLTISNSSARSAVGGRQSRISGASPPPDTLRLPPSFTVATLPALRGAASDISMDTLL